MAQRRNQKDLLGRLSDVGEEALSRVAGSPTASRVFDSVGGMRERLDDVQKKLRGLDDRDNEARGDAAQEAAF